MSETPILLIPPSIPPPPACFSTVLRGILILISAIAIWGIWRAYNLANFLKRWLKRVVNSVVYLITLLLLLFILWLIPPIPAVPACVFTTLGIIALLTSLAFMVAVFCKWLAGKLENFLERQFQHTYWLIFWLVYILGWLKGLSSIPAEGFAFKIVFWIGVAWFFVIPIFYLRAAWQTGKRK